MQRKMCNVQQSVSQTICFAFISLKRS